MENKTKGFILIVLSTLLSGGSLIFSAILRNLGVAPTTQSIVRNLFATITVFIFAFIFNKKILKINKKDVPLFLLLGFLVGAGNIASFSAIMLKTPIAISAFLYQTQPIIIIFLSKIFFKEKVKKNIILSILFGLAGVYFLCTPTSSEKIPIMGVILSLLAAVFFAGEIIFSKKAGDLNLNPFTTFSMSYFSAAIIIILISPLLNYLLSIGTKFSFYIPFQAYFILLLSAFHAIVFISLFYIGVRYLKASTTSIIRFLSPVSATIMGLIFLKEVVTRQIIIGGGLVLLAVVSVIKNENDALNKKKI